MNKQSDQGGQRGRVAAGYQPGVWSTDEYIRAWAVKQGKHQGECLIPLQSLHDSWMARIRFDKPGKPVERFLEKQEENELEEMLR